MVDRDHSDAESEATVRQRITRGTGPFVFVCEHASNRVPPTVELDVDATVLASHAAWDPGAYAVASGLAERFDAPLISARYSRLVYDVNRPPSSLEAMRATSEIHAIPGNVDLSAHERMARTDTYYRPFHRSVGKTLSARRARSQETILVTIHTFSPVYFGELRTFELGILHDEDHRFAEALLAAAGRSGLDTRRNEPYGPRDGVTHTLVEHALPHGLPNAMLEIRNDLVAGEDDQQRFVAILGDMLDEAQARLHAGTAQAANSAVA
ncbi:MAG: N-formylglutamate amidohydrolase [Alphaproteobacteria bacterium]